MKKEEVRVGATYAAKISDRVVLVRITQERWTGDKHTGWKGVNTKTNRPVCIESAAKLHHEVKADHSEQSDPESTAAPNAAPFPGENGAANAIGAVAGPDGGSPNNAARGRKGRGGAKAGKPKVAKPPKPARQPKPKKLSGLDAAAMVLKKAGKPMKFKDIAEEALALGWKTSGKTPHATLYAAAIREIAAKGKESRFRKTDRGLFEHTRVESGKGE